MKQPNKELQTSATFLYFLTYFATSRKIAGPIPDGVIGIFQLLNSFGRTTAMGSIHPINL